MWAGVSNLRLCNIMLDLVWKGNIKHIVVEILMNAAGESYHEGNQYHKRIMLSLKGLSSSQI